MLGIRRSNLDCTRFAWLVLALVTAAEGIANVLMMGYLVADWRSHLLFSEWLDSRRVSPKFPRKMTRNAWKVELLKRSSPPPDDNKTPYACGECGADECKLWRHANTFTDVVLVCRQCLEAKGYDMGPKPTDQVYDKAISPLSYVPAVPDLHGNYWGYTSVPVWWVAWWKALPNRPDDCTLCGGTGKLEELSCCGCSGTGKRRQVQAELQTTNKE